MTRTDWNLGITVEGLGDADAAHLDRQYRFSRLYQDTTAGGGDLYIPAVTEYPSSFAAEVDFRGARSSLGGFAVELQAQAVGPGGVDVATRMYRSLYVPIGFVGLAMSSSVATITINDADGTAITSLSMPLGIALERECLVLTAHSGSGVYVCSRGEFGTVAAAHAIGDGDDTAIFESEHWHIPADRQVVMFRTQRNRDQSNEEVITRGVVRDVSSPTPDRIRLDCAGPLELLQLRQPCGKLWSGTVELVAHNVGRVRGRSASTSPGYANLTTRQDDPSSGLHHALLMVDGKHAVINLWEEVSLRINPNVHVFTGEEEWTTGFVGSPRIKLIEDIDGKKAHEFFSLHPTAPDLSPAGLRLGSATVNGTALTANLFAALLQCLLTTPDGSNHATYDMGDTSNPRIYDNLGFGVPASLVNITGIEDLALELADIARMPLLHFGVDGEGFDGLEFFQQACQLLNS